MNSSKMQRLQLASSVNISFNFFRVIISYEEHCISRLISKQITEFIDASTESLKLVDDSTLRLMHEEEMLQAVKRRLLRCVNVTSMDLSWDLPYGFESRQVKVMTQLVQIAPRLVQLSTDMMTNWMVSTALGTKLYNMYSASEALGINDVLEIVLRCLVARDSNTLSRFGAIPSDLFMTSGFLSVIPSSIHFVNDTTAEACLHYYNCGSRQVQLHLNNNNTWEVAAISEKVDFDGNKCVHCK